MMGRLIGPILRAYTSTENVGCAKRELHSHGCCRFAVLTPWLSSCDQVVISGAEPILTWMSESILLVI
jgi:hypothetical protein